MTDARSLWRQNEIPVVYRQRQGMPLLVRLPYLPDNREWLMEGHQRRYQWIARFKAWQVPYAWFEDVIERALERWGRVYVIQPFRERETCAPACWNALGQVCECSCMGENHGSGNPGGFTEISETFAIRWENRQLGCRLLARIDRP